MECMAKAIDGSGVVDQAKAEPVLFISGWMGDKIVEEVGDHGLVEGQ